jgi:tripeptidyl-peptidase-1
MFRAPSLEESFNFAFCEVVTMYFLTLALSALLLGFSFAVPTPHSGHVRHEKRTHSTQLVRRHWPPPATTLPLRISITQSNLDLGHERLMEISDPTSDKYRPSSESTESVRDWLHSSGINTDRHQVSLGQSWLKFDATVEELESLLSTKYHVYQHTGSQELNIGCDDYHVPQTIHPHIDFISPTVSTLKVTSRSTRQKRDTKSLSPAYFPPHVNPAGISMAPNANDESEIPCHTAVTPACLRSTFFHSAGPCYNIWI